MGRFAGQPDKRVKWTRVPVDRLDLAGRRAVVVGGTGGIGRALARAMAARHAQVTVVGRTFRDAGTTGIAFVRADLLLMSEAADLGSQLASMRPDLIVLTAGIMPGPKRKVTAEGIEIDLAASYLSRLAILREVNPILNQVNSGAKRPRIFVMGFPGTNQSGNLNDLNSEQDYAVMPTHMNTVAGNEALVLHSARRYPNINFYGLNPGIIKTDIRSNVLGGHGSLRYRLVESFIGLLTISTTAYARRIVPLLFSSDIEHASGTMFNQKALAILPSEVMTTAYVDQYIACSEELLERALEVG